MSTEYLTAAEAAQALGVSRQTLYAYVTRKGIRSQATPGSRLRRYWKADIDGLVSKNALRGRDVLQTNQSAITLITERDLFYRGQNVIELAETHSFEAVSALLWGAPEDAPAEATTPPAKPLVARLAKLLDDEAAVNRASAMFPLIEGSSPKSYDISPRGMARTGAEILRWFMAITLRSSELPTQQLHTFAARKLALSAEEGELVRRLLVLAADHGFEPATMMVRAMASTGVTPWRSVLSGLAVGLGGRIRTDNYFAINRFIAEIIAAANPRKVVIQRVQEGEALPGFGSTVYPHGDPRSRALLAFCGQLYGAEPAYRRFHEAVEAVRDICNVEPNFALSCLFVGWKIGLDPGESLFHVGRTAGWIAHAMEQHEAGETEHEWGPYRGPLPP